MRKIKISVLAVLFMLMFSILGKAQTQEIITTASGSFALASILNQGCISFVIAGTHTGPVHAQTSSDNGQTWNDADTFQQSQGIWLTFPIINGRYYSGALSGTNFRLLGPVATGSMIVTFQTMTAACNMYVNAIPNVQLGNGTFIPTAATGPIITTADVIQGMNSADIFLIWSGITGAPANCFLQPQASGDGLNFIPVGPLIPITPGTNQSFNITGPFGLQANLVYLCGTYPTAGTIFIQQDYKQTPPGGSQLYKCTTTVPLTIGAAGTQQIVAPSAGKIIYVCNLVVVTTVAGTVTLTEGTGATCGTGTTNVSGAMTPSVGSPLTFAAGAGTSVFQINKPGDGLCIVNGAATVTGGMASVAQF